MDLATDFAVPLPLRMIADLLGTPVVDQPLFKRWSDVIMALSHALSGGEEAARAHHEFSAASAEMRAYLAVTRSQSTHRVRARRPLLHRGAALSAGGPDRPRLLPGASARSNPPAHPL
jgi:cytochrome P450